MDKAKSAVMCRGCRRLYKVSNPDIVCRLCYHCIMKAGKTHRKLQPHKNDRRGNYGND